MIAKTKNVLKKTALALCLSAVGFIGGAGPAMAYESDPWFHAWEGAEWTPFLSQYTSFVSEVDDQFFAINEYLAEIYQYMTTDVGNTQGMGIIGAINANQDKIWKQQQDFTETTNKNAAQMNRVTATDGAVAHRIANSMADPRNCSEIATVMGARMAGGGGGGGASRSSRGLVEVAVAAQSGGTAPSTLNQSSDIVATHASKYCSTSDVKYTNGKPHAAMGCTAASTTMPDGDARVQSIFEPAHDFTDSASNLKANLTYSTSDQAQAALDSSKTMLSSYSPVGLTPDLEKTPEGKQYLAKVKVFNARISPATNALARISGLRFSEPSLPDYLSTGWKAIAQPVYANIFKGMEVPDKPSEAEVMRFEVLRRYADFGSTSWHQTTINDTDMPHLLQQLNATLAVETYVNWQIYNRMEENNAIQAAILAHLVNPVSKPELENAARAVYSNKQ